jgi:hypothetical protein
MYCNIVHPTKVEMTLRSTKEMKPLFSTKSEDKLQLFSYETIHPKLVLKSKIHWSTASCTHWLFHLQKNNKHPIFISGCHLMQNLTMEIAHN